jgi:predicted ABC-type ATPase
MQHQDHQNLSTPTCWIIAGPNGAGKSTFALEYLPALGCHNFVNADLIAAGLSPLAPERELRAASRLFLREVERYAAARESFAFETTLAGKTYLRLIERLHTEGWTLELLYLALPSVELSRSRVAERVAHGGHNIPEADIVRRFPRSLYNLFQFYVRAVSRVQCFYNAELQPRLVFEQQGTLLTVVDPILYRLLQTEAGL